MNDVDLVAEGDTDEEWTFVTTMIEGGVRRKDSNPQKTENHRDIQDFCAIPT